MRRFAGSSLAPPGAVLGIAVLARIVLDVPTGILVQGALVGGLTSLLALGLVLVWRANRVINFAAGDLGAVPGTLAVLLAVSTVGLGWWAALGVGLVASLLLGIVVHRVVIERFARGPRLVLAAATIGLAQLLASAALFLPRAFSLPGGRLPAPFDASITISPITFHGADVVAVTVIPLVFVALATFLTRTTTGIAVRAGAERSDRLATLGIPLRRIHTVVWAIAAVLAFLAVYLRAGIVGLPLGEVLGPALLLRALAAAVIGRMERLRVVAAAAVALGVVEQAVSWHWREPAYVDPILFVVVVVALLVTRRRAAREPEDSSWEAVREVRPIPRALSRLPEVRATRVAIGVGLVTVLVAVPLVLTPSRTNLAAAILLFGIVGLSLVVLTGWAGQVSLGQVAFVAIGAAVGGAVTDRLGWDLALGVLLAGLAGAAVALVIGLPALRRRGLTLTVTSLALALATSGWLLNRRFFGPGTDLDWLPGDRIARVPLFGAIGVHSETRFYYLCLIALGLAYAAVRGIRASRTGRVLIAGRDDDRATQAVGVHTARTTLFAFAASGFLAAFAGALFVHHQSGLTAGPYRPEASLEVFSMAVIGGLGSAPGVLLGAAFVRSTDFFLAAEWRILATGVGLLAVLAVLPGGLGGGIADARDAWLRRVARRRGIELPGAAAPDIVPTAETQGMSAPAPTTALLALDALEVALGGVSVVRGVSLHVEPGEIVALLGTNGAGKSTVLRAIAGLLPAATGSVRLGGREITGMGPESIAAMGIASAPGGVGVFPSLSVAEHLRLGAWCVRDDPDGTAASDALARFPELAERMATPAGDLSGGQQQMLNLAMALVARPRLLLLDELSLGLSPALVTRLLGAVRELAARGTTVLLVEQSVTLALQVATRAYFLEKGTIRFVGPTKELLERDDLVRAVVLAEAPERAPARAPRARPRASGVRLSVRSVSRHFGGIVALDSVSFDVHDREILGILGPNGAGKTTLFDVLSGFVEPESGEIALHGTEGSGPPLDLHRCSAPTRAQRGLGRTFQTARLFPALTVAEAAAVACEDIVAVRDPIAAALGLPAVRRSEADVEVQVTTMLERFGLDTHRDLFVRELSMGQRRVLSLACALASAPRVLLLDEPSAGITTAETASMAQVLLDIRDDLDVSLVIIEHDLALLRTVADRLLALDVGTVIAEGPPESVLQDPAVVASYLGSPS